MRGWYRSMFVVDETALQVVSKFSSDLRLTPSPLQDLLEGSDLYDRIICLTTEAARVKVKNSPSLFLITDRSVRLKGLVKPIPVNGDRSHSFLERTSFELMSRAVWMKVRSTCRTRSVREGRLR